MWDIGSGRCIDTLTNHKKAVRGVLFHPNEYTFLTAASDNLKVWKCPEGRFLRNFSGHNGIINCAAVNMDNVMVSGGDNGSLYLWDWKSGYNFQQISSKPQPGSISSEAGIFAAKFDRSSLR
jgi:pleiotropic regulator 1